MVDEVLPSVVRDDVEDATAVDPDPVRRVRESASSRDRSRLAEAHLFLPVTKILLGSIILAASPSEWMALRALQS